MFNLVHCFTLYYIFISGNVTLNNKRSFPVVSRHWNVVEEGTSQCYFSPCTSASFGECGDLCLFVQICCFSTQD